MARIEDLIAEVADPDLRARLVVAARALEQGRRFGLVYESHEPEHVALPGAPLAVGDLAQLDGHEGLFRLTALGDDDATGQPHDDPHARPLRAPRADWTTTRRSDRPVFPTVRPVDAAVRGDGRAHVLIEGENLHALQLLGFTHARAFDCIYIDPPYNTGARDWKYDNDYVDDADRYRHSKWLSFMARRLALARQLLAPDGVLIVAIDENENATLGLLLDQTFPGRERTAVAVRHNPRGIQGHNFSYCHEYLHFLVPAGSKRIGRRALSDDEVDWSNLRNWGGESTRDTARRAFYPIFFAADGRFLRAGEVPPDDHHPPADVIRHDDGTLEIWPIDGKGVERKWRYALDSLPSIVDQLRLKQVGDSWQIQLGKTTGPYKTVWADPRFDAGTHGTRLLNRIVSQKFPYPKSVYAVQEALATCVADRPDARILDFFGGSGTTMHATMLLNRADGGRRQCVLVTNNELSDATARALRKQGHGPRSPEWQARGICRSVTWPRCRNVVRGTGDDGQPLSGKTLDGVPLSAGMDASVVFLALELLDEDAVALGSLDPLLPLCWLAAGARGPIPAPTDDTDDWVLADGLAVLRRESRFAAFADLLRRRPELATVFLATDAPDGFRALAAALPATCRPRRLPGDYLAHFRRQATCASR